MKAKPFGLFMKLQIQIRFLINSVPVGIGVMSRCSCNGQLTVSLQDFLQRANSVGVWPLLEDSLGQWVQLHGTKTQRKHKHERATASTG